MPCLLCSPFRGPLRASSRPAPPPRSLRPCPPAGSPGQARGTPGPAMSLHGKRKEIYKYEAPWTVYAMNWSVRPDKRFRLALGSFVEEYNNKVGTGAGAERGLVRFIPGWGCGDPELCGAPQVQALGRDRDRDRAGSFCEPRGEGALRWEEPCVLLSLGERC